MHPLLFPWMMVYPLTMVPSRWFSASLIITMPFSQMQMKQYGDNADASASIFVFCHIAAEVAFVIEL